MILSLFLWYVLQYVIEPLLSSHRVELTRLRNHNILGTQLSFDSNSRYFITSSHWTGSTANFFNLISRNSLTASSQSREHTRAQIAPALIWEVNLGGNRFETCSFIRTEKGWLPSTLRDTLKRKWMVQYKNMLYVQEDQVLIKINPWRKCFSVSFLWLKIADSRGG